MKKNIHRMIYMINQLIYTIKIYNNKYRYKNHRNINIKPQLIF
jgi:hypothetical protein